MSDLTALRVFAALRESPGTIAELTRATGLSRPSTTNALARLGELGWVVAGDSVPDGQNGRPAQRFRYCAEAGALVGIDIGVHRIAGLLTDLAGHRLAHEQVRVEHDSPPSRRLAAMDAMLGSLLQADSVAPGDVWSVAAGVTGPVDERGRTLLSTPLPDWHEVDLVAHLSALFDAPVQVENDVKLALHSEHEWGAARDMRDVVYVLAGVRTGAAVMVDGRVVKGHGGAAGEIGALPAVRWKTAPDNLRETPGLPAELSENGYMAWTAERARMGDETARTLMRRYAQDVATGAAALVLTMDPEAVVVGGGMVAAESLWVPEFSAALSKSVLRMPKVLVSTLGSDHVARGAIRLAMQEVAGRYFGTRLLPVRRSTGSSAVQ
ncbi:ROK family transcriptional regulator [Desertihabitans aurantiacus]|uniref:ROK family transcriptional regulator n=1 Tax=Desertihabitans aurantiacus TaxID=2282477 RepID=UPI0018E57920|nr:ROK family transcriptional regulator [Desertihabitans aurantiacus]